MTEIIKDDRIKEELTRLQLKFELADLNQRDMLGPLLQNAAFMKVTLEDLQEIVNKEGVVDYYQNGANQHGQKQSATLQSYCNLVKQYASIMKTLSALLPPEKKERPSVPYITPEEKEARRAADIARAQVDTEKFIQKLREMREQGECVE